MIGQPNLDEDIINFASDNTSGVDLEIFSVVEQAAKSSAMPYGDCLLYTSPSPRDVEESRMPSSA